MHSIAQYLKTCLGIEAQGKEGTEKIKEITSSHVIPQGFREIGPQ
jgi:hypothetical protein